ncbi:MAG: uncharacterized protein QOJ79_2244 [Actinomycetota bacterium]|jgi:uncharacterized cupin superfamily protein|nr:uncharacterized protein [Actinomycetota bacterium]
MNATEQLRQRKHSPGEEIDLSSFVALGSLENLGATVLEGAAEGWVRIDFDSGGLRAGQFVSSPAKIQFTFPYTEHATILEGEVTFTDEHGRSETYQPGDSYFIARGQVMTCECDARVVKSFFNHTASPAVV